MNNPLYPVVMTLLEEPTLWPLSEHELLGVLVARGALSENYGATPLTLFRTHFCVMNALYACHQQRLSLGMGGVSISPLVIRPLVKALETRDTDGELIESSCLGLSAYYLNWENFRQSTDDSVDALLNDFWARYLTQDDVVEALQALGCDANSDSEDIRRQYRRRMMAAHPDRGGSEASSAKINHAYEVLKRHRRVG